MSRQSEQDVPGTLVLSDEPARRITWHHSIEFDGYRHTTACEREIHCDHIRDVLLDPIEDWRKNVKPANSCGTCHESIHGKLVTDGGIGPIRRIEDIEDELSTLVRSLKTGGSLDLKTRQYEVTRQIDRLRSDLTNARAEIVEQQLDQIFEERKSQRTVSDRPILMEYGYWKDKANENVDEWGLQDMPTLLLAMQEEQGELSQAYLESEYEGANVGRIAAELDDLAALCIQLRWRLENL